VRTVIEVARRGAMCPEGQHLRVDYVGVQTSKLTLAP
jgi:hypothetical protein